MEYMVCEITNTREIILYYARKFTEEEKEGYSKECRDLLFKPVSEPLYLENINAGEVCNLLNRDSDGMFLGSSNMVYVISQEEWDNIIEIDKQNLVDEEMSQREEMINLHKRVIEGCEKQGKLYTTEEANKLRESYNNLYNEGGEGYVPHFYTIAEYEYAKSKIKELKAWDPDFTKLTPSESAELKKIIEDMENGEYVLDSDIDWN